MTDLDVTITETCPNCGLDRSEWTENDGEGVSGSGLTYCSQDCRVRDEARD
jgi:hypothetical protein